MPVEQIQESKVNVPQTRRDPPRKAALEPIGKRIARLRCQGGWTQQALAARLAISRVAVSHIEMDISVPSERTITLLAGVFKLSPHELVESTTYPLAKSERLPVTACCYTPLELDLALLDSDLAWLERLGSSPERRRLIDELRGKWSARLLAWSRQVFNEREEEMIAAARQRLAEV